MINKIIFMKYISILALLFLISCNEQPKQQDQEIQFKAAATLPEISYLPNGDTVIWTQTTKTISYPVWTKTIKPKVIKFNYLSLPLSPAKKISGQSNVVIENLRFENITEAMVYIDNCSNVIIKKCFFNKGGAEGIVFYNVKNVLVDSCLFNGVTTGVYASTSQGVKVNNSQFINMRMRSDGSTRGQFVQFNAVTGEGNEVSGNKGENFAGESNPEDMISMFKSYGTAASPILIKNNFGRGGGPSQSGGGIMLGDYGGGYIIVENNKLLDPGNYIIACAGGTDITIRNNQGYQSLKDWSNIGMYTYSNPSSIGCTRINVTGNNIVCNSKRFPPYNNYYFPMNKIESCKESNWSGNSSTITIAELGIPVDLIDFVTQEELLKIRK